MGRKEHIKDYVLMSEADLIEAVRNSDSDAFAVVFRRYYPVIQRFVYALLKDERFSEDIAQDVFAKLWLYRERLEPE
ncbi:MAG: sigma factor, partial [Bacteroidales bacterium]